MMANRLHVRTPETIGLPRWSITRYFAYTFGYLCRVKTRFPGWMAGGVVLHEWNTALLKTLVVACFVMAFVAGCGSNISTPSEEAAKTVFVNMGGSGFDQWKSLIKIGKVKLTSFKKINGQMSEVNGVKVYAFEYETSAEMLEDIKPTSILDFSTAAYKKGEKFTDKGRLMFAMTEKGWQGADGKVY